MDYQSDIRVDDLFLAGDEYDKREAILALEQAQADINSDSEAQVWYAQIDADDLASQMAAHAMGIF